MRILLDECLPTRLRHEIPGHEVRTVKQMGWLGVKNGKLLRSIEESNLFEVFVTMDKNLPQQQRLAGLSFGVIVLRARSNRFEQTQPLMAELLRRLLEVSSGKVVVIPGQLEGV
jgi:predicted nuclease of predicted toxin-antitoxin system